MNCFEETEALSILKEGVRVVQIEKLGPGVMRLSAEFFILGLFIGVPSRSGSQAGSANSILAIGVRSLEGDIAGAGMGELIWLTVVGLANKEAGG